MKFVLASTLPTTTTRDDDDATTYLLALALWLVRWSPFDAPSVSMTFWRRLEARAGALLGARGKAFCCVDATHIFGIHSLTNFNIFSFFSIPRPDFQKTRSVSMWHLFAFRGPWSFPTSSSSQRGAHRGVAWRRHFGLFGWQSFAIIELLPTRNLRPQMTHTFSLASTLA